MYYHAKLLYGDEKIYYSNWTKDEIVEMVLVPFVNGQVILLKKNNTILNLKTVSELKIYKTESEFTEELKLVDENNGLSKYDCTNEIINETKLLLSSSNSTSLLEKTLKTEINQVFIIMKFGDKILDSAYDGVIKPLFTDFKIKTLRVDEIQDSGKISDQILQKIAESKFIIAELTGERPNCYYETGFAHALGKEIILCIHSTSKVHFDLADHRFIEWETESELRKKLKARIKSLLS